MPQPLPLASSLEMLLVLIGFRRYVRVINQSMMPTLYPGDVVVLHEGAYRWRRPLPGDIVVAENPDSTQPRLIKRVQSVIKGNSEGCVDSSCEGNGMTKDDCYFLISDNASLPESRDSRFYGTFPLDAIIGKITSKLPNRA